ncbi:hypothetical protein L6452_09750 [Arctium lappa]|uniref:Uncharacterized protein n=1 Tax=Arctium lappa TaxID=4217 RepID=A0ACB9DM35_ARCLA|nr:hypothetical protein L6452_09750 [Arctium lappa]
MEYENFDKSLEYIEELMIKHAPIDVLLGFSQGAILSAALPGLQAKMKMYQETFGIHFIRDCTEISSKLFKVLGSETSFTAMKSVGVASTTESTVIELIGTDRPRLLSEVSAVLTHLKCNVLNAEVWTHNIRVAFIVQVTDDESVLAIADTERLSIIKQMLCNVLKGNKITDEEILDYIQKVLGSETIFTAMKSVGVASTTESTVTELMGTDRPGLLSEVSAVLTHFKCNVLNAEVWTHNTQAAFIVQVTDDESGLAIANTERLSIIKQMLCNVLKGSNKFYSW